MTAMWAPTVTAAKSFETDVDDLREEFPDIHDSVEEFSETLKSYWTIPHFPVDEIEHPNVFAAKLDYPPMGADGVGIFIATYHTSPTSLAVMQQPLRIFTLISLTKT